MFAVTRQRCVAQYTRNPISASFFVSSIRNKHYVVKKLKAIDNVGRTIGDHKSDLSKSTIKWFRRLGAISVVVVLGSIVWASTGVQPEIEFEPIEDLTQDVRK
jgi:hypothetical protein